MKCLVAICALVGCGDSAATHLPDAPAPDAPADAALPASTLDPGFGDHGRVVRTSGACQRMVLDASGRPLLLLSDGSDHYTLARYTVEGALDPSFGTGGEVAVASIPLFDAFVFALPSGKLLVTATSSDNNTHHVYRFDVDGTPDTGFGTAGDAVTITGAPFGTFAAGERASGGIDLVAIGNAAPYTIARLTAAGALDSTFGSGGIATPQDAIPGDYFPHFAYLADGRFVITAATFPPQGPVGPSVGHFMLVQDDVVLTTTTADNTQYLWMVHAGDHAYALAATASPNKGVMTRVDANLVIDPTFAPSVPLDFQPQFGLYNGGELAVATTGALMATNGQFYDRGGSTLLRWASDGTPSHADDIDAMFGGTDVAPCGLAFDAFGQAVIAGNAGATGNPGPTGIARIVRTTAD